MTATGRRVGLDVNPPDPTNPGPTKPDHSNPGPARPDPTQHSGDVERRLRALRRDTAGRQEALRHDFDRFVEASQSVSNDDEHDPEGATIAFERAQVAALLDQTERRLAELDDAIARLDDGGYGVCTGCGRPIAAERLVVRPAATTCIACAR